MDHYKMLSLVLTSSWFNMFGGVSGSSYQDRSLSRNPGDEDNLLSV